jgi:hypothetical protein
VGLLCKLNKIFTRGREGGKWGEGWDVSTYGEGAGGEKTGGGGSRGIKLQKSKGGFLQDVIK